MPDELYSTLTISVSVRDNADVDISDDDAISQAFSIAEQAVRNHLDSERFSVDSDA